MRVGGEGVRVGGGGQGQGQTATLALVASSMCIVHAPTLAPASTKSKGPLGKATRGRLRILVRVRVRVRRLVRRLVRVRVRIEPRR